MSKLLFALAAAALAQTTLWSQAQIADLRLEKDKFDTEAQAFDPGFGPFETRTPPIIISGVKTTFSGLTQSAADLNGNDIALRTYYVSTNIMQLNRYAVDEKKVRQIGAVQWLLDVSGLDEHLAKKRVELESLELRLVWGGSPEFKVDVCLSPGRPALGAKPVDLLTLTSEDCYHMFWLPAQGRSPGDVVRIVPEGEKLSDPSSSETVRVLRNGVSPSGVVTVDLAADYKAGVRKFGLIVTSAAFGAGRQVSIREGSGLFLVSRDAER